MEVEVALPFSQATATCPEIYHLLHTITIFLSRSILVAFSDLRLRLANPSPLTGLPREHFCVFIASSIHSTSSLIGRVTP
jgi:hypothetical protein